MEPTKDEFYVVHFPHLIGFGEMSYYVFRYPYRSKEFSNFLVNLLAVCTQPIPDANGKTPPRKSPRKE